MIVNVTWKECLQVVSLYFHSNVNSKVYTKGKHELRTDKYTKDKNTEMLTNIKQISLAWIALQHLLPCCIYKRPNDVA